jgi:hypothetical protein
MNNVFLFSQGSSGTGYTLKNFDWHEGIYGRHDRNPIFKNKDDKFVYLFNNPIDILLSFQRRNFLKGREAIKNLQGDLSYNVNDIVEYARNNKDYFLFENHFNSFFNQENKGLFIKFEGLDKGWDEIESFTKMKRKNNFEWLKKLSNPNILNDVQYNMLHDIYKDWIARYNEMPNFFYNK